MYDSIYSYKSSNAHKLDYNDFEYRTKKGAAPKNENKRVKKVAAKKNAGVNPFAVFIIAAVFMAAFFTVKGYVQIYEADNKIADLKKDLRMIEADNQAVKAKVDKSVDLKNLQKTANEKFGMVRPENYQIFYVNLDFGDYSENMKKENVEQAEENSHPEGVTGVLISSANMFK